MLIGILGLQGAFIEHQNCLSRMKINNIIVKNINDFNIINALIIPGGESTVMIKLLKENNLLERLNKFIHLEKKPVMGICAGIILLASPEINGFKIKIKRNFYGSQTNSFINLNKLMFSNETIKGIYIRAPKILEINDNDINILAKNELNEITGIKKDNLIGFTFHPELTDDLSIHKYFINLIDKDNIYNCNKSYDD